VIPKEPEIVGATRLRASYGAGIKAPTLVEAFSPNSFFLGNPGLKPERAHSFDAGLEQLFWRDRVRVEATYFENRFRDQIAYVGDPATFGGPIKTPDGVLTSFVNNDRARARGLELSLAVQLSRQWRFGGSYTLTDSRLLAAADVIDFVTLKLVPSNEIGLPLLRRPKHSGTFNISWIGERFDAQLNGFFLGRRRDVDPVTFSRTANNDGYARLDLGGGYRLTPRVTAFARIENLLNQNYQEVLGYPAYRLNFSAGLRVRIGGEK
jgi:outer membrane receptor protein involved in Fe transport